MPGESCIHHLILITHEIYVSFEASLSLEVEKFFKIYLKLLIECSLKGLFIR